MTLFICLVIIVPMILLLNKYIRKYPINFYLGSLIIGLILLIAPKVIGFPLLNQRYIGLSLLIIVMFIGALNRKKSYTIKLLAIRGDLAIMGFIFVSFHAIKHLLNDQTYPIVYIFGFITYSLLLPLTITSFKKVRKWMGPKTWKRIHTLSYGVYLTVFIHIYLASSSINQIIYLSIFILYTTLRLLRLVASKKGKKQLLLPQAS